MFSILLYYSHFLTWVLLLASLWSRKGQHMDIHQSTLVLLCHRVTGNVLRITTFALSQWFQSDVGVQSWIPSFIYSLRWVWMTCSQVLCFQKSIQWHDLSFSFWRNSIGVWHAFPIWAKAHIWMNTYFPLLPKPPRHFYSEYQKKRNVLCSLHTFQLVVCARTASPTFNCHQHKCQILYYKQWVTSVLMTKKMLYGADSNLAQHLDHLLF